MSIAAEQISEGALLDMMLMFNEQEWTRELQAELVALWQLCETRDQQLLLRRLILSFVVLDQKAELSACRAINEQFQAWGLDASTTRVVAVADDGEVDGSTAGLQKLKNKIIPYESWHSRFYPSIASSMKEIQNGDSVVLFDDFIGTGNKVGKKVDWIRRFGFQNGIEFSLHCISFAGMRFGLKNLADSWGLPVFSALELERGISEMMSEDEVPAALALMRQIESKLSARYKNKKVRDYSMGYGGSEALYFWMNDNCPNNVFPIFWWPKLKGGSVLRTLLQRAG